MKRSGAWLAVRALEEIGVVYAFGIPGVHTTELYDALAESEQITPILVTHEGCATFMADAVSRTTDTIGCAAIVPGAGMTHAMSGIGEAYLAGVPMLVISGGIRRDSGRHYQVHAVDQQRILDGIVKASFLVEHHDEVVPAIFEAFEIATSGEPGPVFVEIAGELLLFASEVGEVPTFERRWSPPGVDGSKVAGAVEMVRSAQRPGLYLGWGARDATDLALELAERIGAPVATTLQGLSVFPANHPLHAGFGFGPAAVPAAKKAFEGCDCLVAVGARFSEVATGSYGMPVPEKLVHIDINCEVFDKNYPASIAIEADAGDALRALLEELERTGEGSRQWARAAALRTKALGTLIEQENLVFARSWTEKVNSEQVSPGIFFRELRARLDDRAFLVVDDGNHTFLAVEQFPVYRPKSFLSPTDFNCMGYCVPAAIGVKLSHPDQQVVAVVGDGALLMTGLEIVTAAAHQLGVVFFVFHDGELGQISQFQQIPLNRKTCTVLGDVNVEGIALATGAAFLRMENDQRISDVIEEALQTAATGRPVIVDVSIDYSRKSVFTKAVVRTNLGRFPLREKLRFIGRAIKRHTLG